MAPAQAGDHHVNPNHRSTQYPRGAHLVVGSVAQVLDLLWPPTEPHVTGNSIQVDTGSVEIKGLRLGSQVEYIGGEVIHLDPRLLRGTEWSIEMTTAGGKFLVGSGADFVLQRFGSSGWVNVPNNFSLGAARLRVAPAGTG